MPVRYVLLFFSLLTSSFLFAQSVKLSGKVTNEKNEPLSGVSIHVTGANGGFSNADGTYTLNLATGKKYEIQFSAVGYTAKTIADVEVASAAVNELNVVLETVSKDLTNVLVTTTRSTARRESVNSIIAFQKNTNTVASVISAETIRRSPDRNTGDVLKRIPGTSVQEGKYLIVRGLSDRYNLAMLNGVPLSSTEPDRKTFSFDIFPSAVIDNIVINKAFVPELPAEWAGGLVQINTREIPTKGFLTVQIGTGFNSQTIGRDFYTYKGGKLDWLGVDDGTRGLPSGFPTKSAFVDMKQNSEGGVTELAKKIATSWSINKGAAPLNTGMQVSGGFTTKILNKTVGGTLALIYSRSNRNLDFTNGFYSFQNNTPSLLFDYNNNRYGSETVAGAMANFSVRLNNNNKISIRNIINVNTLDYTTLRTGLDYEQDPILGENIRARELGFRSNTFFNMQVNGEHNISSIGTKLNWYGSFNILDGYIPAQRRIQYNQSKQTANAPYTLVIGPSRSQKSGSVFYSMLSDYIYTGGGDLTKNFRLFNQSQSIKGGYLLQIKDRLFDSRPFSIYLPSDNPALRSLSEDVVFAPENFSATDPKLFHFDEIAGKQFRYLANTILNAGFIQFDNQFAKWLRIVWGVRYEHYDQLVGSTKKSDPRFTNSVVEDFLPAFNATIKVDAKTNIRLSASQTLVRPEFRELTNFTFYDFELGAGVLGTSNLKRTKITNLDLRYELYPKAGELVTLGVFYKQFKNPIELYFNQSGVATNTFNYLNAAKANSYGAEVEFRKKLDFFQPFKNLTVQANLSYIYNRVEDSLIKIDRPMQGQSPYLINASLQYDIEKLGLNTTVLFNQIGRRILYVGNEAIPEIWEAPRPLLDLQIAKRLLKGKAEVKLNATDILNRTANYYHDVDNNKGFKKGSADVLAISRKYGTNFSITFGYNIK